MTCNQAVTQLLSIQRTPTDTDFDPDLVVNHLSLAIRHYSEIHGDQGTQHFVTVHGRAAAAALTDLTVAQGTAVEARWEVRDKHNLRKLLNGGYKSVYLSSGRIERLIAPVRHQGRGRHRPVGRDRSSDPRASRSRQARR